MSNVIFNDITAEMNMRQMVCNEAPVSANETIRLSDMDVYIPHSLADAANDFLVASEADTFVKKTLAETGAILETDINHDNLVDFLSSEHFTEGSIDHGNILNIGSNTHAQIDTHIGLSNEHIDWTDASADFDTSGSLNVDGIVTLNNTLTVEGETLINDKFIVKHTSVGNVFEIWETDGGNVAMSFYVAARSGVFYLKLDGNNKIQMNANGHSYFNSSLGLAIGATSTPGGFKFYVDGKTKLGSASNYVEVEADGDVNFVGGAGLQFGEIYASDISDTITITGIGQGNKAQITSFAINGESNGSMTPDHANDHITVVKAGRYLCIVSLHIESTGGGGADTFGISVYKNDGTTEFQNCHAHRDLAGGGGDVGSVSISGIIDIAANDTIELWVWNEDSTDDIVIDDVTLSLMQIGGT